jgi:hypothetical protein
LPSIRSDDMSDKKDVIFQSETAKAEHDEGVEMIVDLEEYARLGKVPPLAKGYRIKVNGESFVVNQPQITGREVLVVAALTPPDKYTLRVKVSGQPPKKVELDEQIDLRAPGVEKFKALPRDQTEG